MKAAASKSRNIFWGVIIFLVIAGIIVYFWFRHRAETPAFNAVPGSSAAPGSVSSFSAGTVDVNRILHKGDTGATVKELQRLINLKLPSAATKLVEDGVYGNATDTALKQVTNNVLASANNNVSISALNGLSISTPGSPAPSPTGYQLGQNVYSNKFVNIYASNPLVNISAEIIKSVYPGEEVGTFLSLKNNGSIIEVSTEIINWYFLFPVVEYKTGYLFKADVM